MSKIIMLDIDGVLFVYRTYNFSKAACNNLKKLLDEVPDLQIVICSSWRHLGLDSVKTTLDFHGIPKERIIGCTGDLNGTRGDEVREWMNKNPGVTNYVIIDDDREFPGLEDHLVRPNSFAGLTSADVKLAIDILKLPV